jgi:hypothetical protein
MHPWYSSFTGFACNDFVFLDIINGFVVSDWYLVFQDVSDSRFIYKGLILLLDFFSNSFYYSYYDLDWFSILCFLYFFSWYIKFFSFGLNFFTLSRLSISLMGKWYFSSYFKMTLLFKEYKPLIFFNFLSHRKDFFVRINNYFNTKNFVKIFFFNKFK